MQTFHEVVTGFAAQIRSFDVIEIEDIPNIDLYMDQVTTFMNKGLSRYKRNEQDKILTKTMINNYTKAKIFPAPIKKKYSPAHLMLLIMIYHLKSVLSIHDIGVLFRSALTEPNKEKQARMIRTIYSGFVLLQKANKKYLLDAAEGRPDESYYGQNQILEFFEQKKRPEFNDDEIKRILLTLALVLRSNAEKQLAEKALDSYF